MNNWISLSQTAGTGNAVVTVSPNANPSAITRSATIKVSNGSITKTVYVSQNAAPLRVNSIDIIGHDTYAIPYLGGSATTSNIRFNVMAYYNDGTSRDQVPATVTGNTVTAMTSLNLGTTPDTAGTIHAVATFSGKSDSTDVTIYQQPVPEDHYMVFYSTSDINISQTGWSSGSSCNVARKYWVGGSGVIVFDNTVSVIPTNAFSGNSSLTSVWIPDSVVAISAGAFAYCNSATSLTYEGTVNDWNSIYKADGWYANSAIEVVHCSDDDVWVNDRLVSIYFSGVNVIPVPYTGGTVNMSSCNPYVKGVFRSGAEMHIGNGNLSFTANPVTISTVNTATTTTQAGTIQISASYSGASATTVLTATTNASIPQYPAPDTNRINYSGTTAMAPYSQAEWGTGVSIIASGYTDGFGTFIFNAPVTYLGANSNNIFRSTRSNLITIDIPSGVTSVSSDIFSYCNNLIAVNNFEKRDHLYLANNAGGQFRGCPSLSAITLPGNITGNGGAPSPEMFAGCTSLNTLGFSGTSSQWNALSKASNWRTNSAVRYVQCTDGTIDLDQSTDNVIKYYASAKLPEVTGKTYPDYYTGLNINGFTPALASSGHTFENGVGTLTFPSAVTKIGGYTFAGCSGMTNILIPDNVSDMNASGIFARCSSLSTVTLPSGLTSIGTLMFNGCSALTSIDIPVNVTDIGELAFGSCTGLTTVNMSSGITNIVRSAFDRCSSLTSVTIPDSVTTLGSSSFSNCSGLITATLPSGLTIIDTYTFNSCNALEDVYLPTALTEIKKRAFNLSPVGRQTALNFHYPKTMSDWNNITLASDWIYSSHSYPIYVICSDGTITI